MDTHQTLIASIEAFDIDGGQVQFSFADRLADEQGWTPDFTHRVIREYKRFVALAMISETPVTPSLVVDEAWHLHLIYTRSYWERFMPLLPRPLHHEPTKGGQSEDTKHKNQFSSTLDLYRQTFGEEAPVDIWRAKPKSHERTPELKSNWFLGGALGVLASLTGCTAVAQASAPPIFPIIIGVWVVIFVFIAINAVRQRRPGNSQNGSSGGGCSSGSGCGTSGGHGSSGHCSGGGHCSGASGGDGGSGGGDGGGGCGGGGCGGD